MTHKERTLATNEETVADIIAEMRERCIDEEHSPLLWSYLDRLESAHKREREATRDKSSQVGNAEMCKCDNDKPMTLDEAIAHAEEAVAVLVDNLRL